MEEITIDGFKAIFERILKLKKDAGICAIHNNPQDLLERAKLYGTRYKNGSWGWTSNIWSRSAAGSVVVEREDDLKPEHKQLMRSVLEQILCRPLIQVDASLCQPGSRAQMKARLYIDPQFPDIAYRWTQLNFPGEPAEEPDVTIFSIPHYLENPNVPGSQEMLKVLRFPNHNYTIVTASSYQGEVKKGFLSHWIYHVYQKGGTGEHAALKEFTVRRIDGKEKRVVMCVWGLTGSGKSTHGMYIFDEDVAPTYKNKFGVDILKLVWDQVIKNDDIVGIFEEIVECPERSSWTKTEDVDEAQPTMFRAGMSPRALHENTEFGPNGSVSFKGELFQYHGLPQQNARTVFYLEDTGYFDKDNVNSTAPLNTAVFISPGYITDYAWLKLNDVDFAAKVLADGRTTGHPAQSRKDIGKVRYVSRYCLPFTMGVDCASHVVRFHEFLKRREDTDNPIEVYQLNTTGRIGAEYDWLEIRVNDSKMTIPQTRFEEIEGKIKPIGGTGPSIEETELFLLQATRGAVKYEPHPIWAKKVLVPIRVEGIASARLKELNPFTYRSKDEMKRLLMAQILMSKHYLDRQCPGLPQYIYNAMDF